MGSDLAGTDLLLHGVGKQLDQSQAARHPARAAIELAAQILQAVAEALFQFRQEPALFQSRFGFGETHRPVQHQRLGVAHRPDHGLHRVPAQLFQRRHPLVAVNDPIPVRPSRNRHDHDRGLLPGLGQRGQQPPLPLPIPDPQMFIPAIQLVKLQRDDSRFRHALILEQARSGIAPMWGEVCRKVPAYQYDRPRTEIARPQAQSCP